MRSATLCSSSITSTPTTAHPCAQRRFLARRAGAGSSRSSAPTAKATTLNTISGLFARRRDHHAGGQDDRAYARTRGGETRRVTGARRPQDLRTPHRPESGDGNVLLRDSDGSGRLWARAGAIPRLRTAQTTGRNSPAATADARHRRTLARLTRILLLDDFDGAGPSWCQSSSRSSTTSTSKATILLVRQSAHAALELADRCIYYRPGKVSGDTAELHQKPDGAEGLPRHR